MDTMVNNNGGHRGEYHGGHQWWTLCWTSLVHTAILMLDTATLLLYTAIQCVTPKLDCPDTNGGHQWWTPMVDTNGRHQW